MFFEPLVAKFQATGCKEGVNLTYALIIAGGGAYLPQLHVPNYAICDLTERPSVRTVGLLIGVPPLQLRRISDRDEICHELCQAYRLAMTVNPTPVVIGRTTKSDISPASECEPRRYAGVR